MFTSATKLACGPEVMYYGAHPNDFPVYASEMFAIAFLFNA